MKTHQLKPNFFSVELPDAGLPALKGKLSGIVAILCLLWFLFPIWMRIQDPTSGYIDQSIWLLLVFSLLTFLIITGLCWWLLKQFWVILGLPAPHQLFIPFKFLSLCQQFSFFFASLALLLLAAIGCVLAIC